MISPQARLTSEKMGENHNRYFMIPIFLGLCATQAIELKTMTSDTFKEAFSDNKQGEFGLYSKSKTGIHSVLSPLGGRYKRESVTRSRRQGLGLLPTEEENGESVIRTVIVIFLRKNTRNVEKITDC